MRVFMIVYVIVAFGISIASVFVPFFPGTEVISWSVDDNGKFSLTEVLGILMIMFLLPVVIVVMVINRMRSIKVGSQEEPIDQTGIEITREKAMYAAMYGIDIYLNGKKKGLVRNGATLHLALPIGEQAIFAKSMGKTTDPIQIMVSGDGKVNLAVGFELVDGKQRLFLKTQ